METTLSPLKSLHHFDNTELANKADTTNIQLVNSAEFESNKLSSVEFSLPFQFTDDSLVKHIQKNAPVYRMLRLSGVIWSSEGSDCCSNIFQFFWSIFVRLFLFISIIYGYLIADAGAVFMNAGMLAAGICIIAQVLVLFPSIIEIQSRLKAPVSSFDLMFYSDTLYWCKVMFVMTFLAGSLYAVLGMALPTGPLEGFAVFLYVSLILGQLAYSALLSVNLLFVLLDCKVSSVLVDQLTALHHAQQLTVDKFNMVRKEISLRVKRSLWLNYGLVVVAICNLLAALLLLLFSHFGLIIFIGAVFLLGKELPFLALVFFKSAGVNEKVDKLTRMLGCERWETDHEKQCNTRMMLYINAEAQRISFPMAGLRMSYQDITRQCIGWLAATAFAVIKAIVSSSGAA